MCVCLRCGVPQLQKSVQFSANNFCQEIFNKFFFNYKREKRCAAANCGIVLNRNKNSKCRVE